MRTDRGIDVQGGCKYGAQEISETKIDIRGNTEKRNLKSLPKSFGIVTRPDPKIWVIPYTTNVTFFPIQLFIRC
jgi:hypothetical protein